MKKQLLPIASLTIGIICSVAIIGHQTYASVPDQLDDHPRATVGDGVIQYAPESTSNDADQDVTPSVQHSMKTKRGEENST
jgi:hypothetical protein